MIYNWIVLRKVPDVNNSICVRKIALAWRVQRQAPKPNPTHKFYLHICLVTYA